MPKEKMVSRTWFHYCVISSKGNKPTLPKISCYWYVDSMHAKFYIDILLYISFYCSLENDEANTHVLYIV